jgi:hypothetical protein
MKLTVRECVVVWYHSLERTFSFAVYCNTILILVRTTFGFLLVEMCTFRLGFPSRVTLLVLNLARFKPVLELSATAPTDLLRVL